MAFVRRLRAAALIMARLIGTSLLLAGVGTVTMNGLRHGPAPYTGISYLKIFTTSDFFFLAGAVLLLPSIMHLRREVLRHAAPILLAVALMVAGGLAGTIASPDPRGSVVNIAQLLVAAIGLHLLIALWAPSTGQVRLAILFFVVSAIITGVLGLLWVDDLDLERAKGPARHPNHLGVASAMASGPALAFLMWSRGWHRWEGGVAVLLLAGAVMISGSRAGLIGLWAVMALFALFSGVRRGTIPAAIMGGFVILVLAGVIDMPDKSALSRLFGLGDEATSADNFQEVRRPLLTEALRQIRESPLFGHGYAEIMATHNIYLQLWAGAGLLGLAGLLLALWTAARWMLEARASLLAAADHEAAALLFGLSAAMLGYFVTGIFEPTLWERWIWIAPALAAPLLPYVRWKARASE